MVETHAELGLHECDHDCDCLWCKLSRREEIPPVTDTWEVER